MSDNHIRKRPLRLNLNNKCLRESDDEDYADSGSEFEPNLSELDDDHDIIIDEAADDSESKKISSVNSKFTLNKRTRNNDNPRKRTSDENGTDYSELTRVSGIGPNKAAGLVKLGIKTIADLNKNSDKLNSHQLMGLKYLDQFEEAIPRDQITLIKNIINTEIKLLDEKFNITICGSYRRGHLSSKGIDILVNHSDYTSDKNKSEGGDLLKMLITQLVECDLIIEMISLSDTEFMGACKLPESNARRFDIRIIPYDQYACSIMYFTGSYLFNQRFQQMAVKKGFKLNKYNLRPVGSTGVPGEAVRILCEEDIFDYIDVEFISPENRNT